MPRIKIVQENWTGYTGYLGSVEFVDGESVGDISPLIAQQISCIVSCEDLDTGENHNVAHKMVMQANVEMSADMPLPDLAQIKEAQTQETPEAPLYTKEQLEDIASKSGIGGLRAIADNFAIKANSIVKLIDAMLKAGLRDASAVAAKVEAEVESVVEKVEDEVATVVASAAEHAASFVAEAEQEAESLVESAEAVIAKAAAAIKGPEAA
jgi:hypothetical protein